MASTWEQITQTHRAILFEEFTHPHDNTVTNLYDILSNYNDPDMSDDDMSKEIEEKLEVHSFDEFLGKKFSPKVYEYSTGTADSIPTIQYTTDPVKASKFKCRPIDLTEQTYYKMLVNMYLQKGDRGVANIEFNDAEVREILTPKSEIEALYDKRRQIPFLMEKQEALIKKNENPAPIVKRIKQIRKEALNQIQSPTAIMSLALADTQQKIQFIDSSLKQLSAPGTSENSEQNLLSGPIVFNEKGRLIMIPAKTSASDDEKIDSSKDPAGDNMKKLAVVMKKDLDSRYEDSRYNGTKALIVSAYTGVDLQAAKPIHEMGRTELVEYRERLIDTKQLLEDSFRRMKEAFVKELSAIVQKVLSVKIFFDHATVKGGNTGTLPKAGLIIANCKVSKLISDNIKEKFKKTMEDYGTNDRGENKIWFAILPNVKYDEFASYSSKIGSWDDDDLDEIDEDEDSTDSVSFAAATSLLKIMDEAKIMTVFNFKPTPKTTFSNITAKTIDDIQNELSSLKNEHAIYALPNFTIMKEGTIPLNDEPNAPKIEVPAIYIDASYVAAGLLVAAQQPDFWISRGFKNKENFLTENACVRIDLESGEVTRKLLTKFNRERYSSWSKDVIDAFTKKRFGFVFDGDRKYDEKAKKFIDNTYILNARTLNRNDEGEYQPIFAVLMKDFVDTYKRTYGVPLTSSSSKDFFDNVVTGWSTQSRKYKNGVINLLLRDGEIIEDKGSEWEITLKNGEKFINVSINVQMADS